MIENKSIKWQYDLDAPWTTKIRIHDRNSLSNGQIHFIEQESIKNLKNLINENVNETQIPEHLLLVCLFDINDKVKYKDSDWLIQRFVSHKKGANFIIRYWLKSYNCNEFGEHEYIWASEEDLKR